MKAKFIGENGSMGFKKGKIYDLNCDIKPGTWHNNKRRAFIYLYSKCDKSWCPYESLEAVLANWEIIG